MGDYKKAEPLCKQVLEMERKTTGENHPSYATSLNNLALLYQSMGEYAKAEPLLKRAADIDRKALGEDHMEYARSLSNLALVYESMNEYAKAESLHKKTLEIRLKALGENHPDSATSLNNLAHLYAAWDKPVEALEFFNSGMKSLHSHALKVLAGLSEERKLEFLHQVWPKFEAYLTFILDHPNASGSLASGALWLARWKALSAEVQTEQYRMLRVVNDTETRRILEQLESARRDLARWTLSPPLKMKPEDIRVRREQKEAKMAELEDALAKKSAEFAELRKLGSADLAQIAQALPENGALLDFACFRQFNFKAKTRQAKWGDYRYILFITPSRSTLHASRSTDQVVLVDLGPAKPVDDAVVAFRSAVEPRPYELRITDYESRITQPLKTLSNLVLTPILPHIKDKKHLIICPDGQLSLVPFECLLTDDRKYLLESVHISYLSAGREAVAYGGIETVLAQQAAPLLLGDPDFDVPLVIHRRRGALHRAEATPPAGSALSRAEEWPLQALRASRDLGAARFPGLPGTRSEVELAAKMIGGKVLIERSATESAVKQASRPDLLYLATHGFFLADQEVNPEKSLGKVRGVTVGDESQPVPRLRIENPLLRCGLALAGANNRDTVSPDSWADDGILTGMEVAGLDLRGTKLVVLSACETGIGDVRQGEGVMGLRRAFLLAGAKRVLATLWKVPDDQTQELMTDFVKRWQAGSPPAEALREAQLGMIERLRKERGQAHPFFWAAFTMTGDWR
jgi:CHAT domain-containing protein